MTTTTSSRTGLDRFFEATNNSSLRRSPDKMVAGVCSAIAHRLGVAPKIVRIAAVVLAFFGPMLAIYLLAWILLPDASGRGVLDRAVRGGEGKAIALSAVTALVVLGDLGIRVRFLVPMLIVGGIVAAVMLKARGGSGRGSAGGYHGSSAYGPNYPGQAPYGQPYAGQPTQAPYGQPGSGQQAPQDAPRW
ncbi:hypothetical protein BN11_2430008 [Nostocoides australiense Ben110]|uniref:Phage shock protein PspC N-terminal domain-containing protein n=1 Tax=Nostocoides australiense Ben110 TaxID=1193182 RepID=W6JX52_9MICO|nr:PspC domain-containing protein [Tetrasphaera australiensis]CCH73215.1 hypothetical protein BN11_2430008 [Tetrasphaera australiensis Ben110]